MAECDVIVGNPPFLGDKFMRRELGDDYVEELRRVYHNRIPGQSDLCCYWFEKAREQIESAKCKRAGLLATQGIRGGASREVLKRIKTPGDIFFAESDRDWILAGATVHVSRSDLIREESQSDGLDGREVSDNHTTAYVHSRFLSCQNAPSFVGFSFMELPHPVLLTSRMKLRCRCYPRRIRMVFRHPMF
jgi:type II restriction/modification system DNA methylase subunit YeeA